MIEAVHCGILPQWQEGIEGGWQNGRKYTSGRPWLAGSGGGGTGGKVGRVEGGHGRGTGWGSSAKHPGSGWGFDGGGGPCQPGGGGGKNGCDEV